MKNFITRGVRRRVNRLNNHVSPRLLFQTPTKIHANFGVIPCARLNQSHRKISSRKTSRPVRRREATITHPSAPRARASAAFPKTRQMIRQIFTRVFSYAAVVISHSGNNRLDDAKVATADAAVHYVRYTHVLTPFRVASLRDISLFEPPRVYGG